MILTDPFPVGILFIKSPIECITSDNPTLAATKLSQGLSANTLRHAVISPIAAIIVIIERIAFVFPSFDNAVNDLNKEDNRTRIVPRTTRGAIRSFTGISDNTTNSPVRTETLIIKAITDLIDFPLLPAIAEQTSSIAINPTRAERALIPLLIINGLREPRIAVNPVIMRRAPEIIRSEVANFIIPDFLVANDNTSNTATNPTNLVNAFVPLAIVLESNSASFFTTFVIKITDAMISIIPAPKPASPFPQSFPTTPIATIKPPRIIMVFLFCLSLLVIFEKSYLAISFSIGTIFFNVTAARTIPIAEKIPIRPMTLEIIARDPIAIARMPRLLIAAFRSSLLSFSNEQDITHTAPANAATTRTDLRDFVFTIAHAIAIADSTATAIDTTPSFAISSILSFIPSKVFIAAASIKIEPDIAIIAAPTLNRLLFPPDILPKRAVAIDDTSINPAKTPAKLAIVTIEDLSLSFGIFEITYIEAARIPRDSASSRILLPCCFLNEPIVSFNASNTPLTPLRVLDKDPDTLEILIANVRNKVERAIAATFAGVILFANSSSF